MDIESAIAVGNVVRDAYPTEMPSHVNLYLGNGRFGGCFDADGLMRREADPTRQGISQTVLTHADHWHRDDLGFDYWLPPARQSACRQVRYACRRHDATTRNPERVRENARGYRAWLSRVTRRIVEVRAPREDLPASRTRLPSGAEGKRALGFAWPLSALGANPSALFLSVSERWQRVREPGS